MFVSKSCRLVAQVRVSNPRAHARESRYFALVDVLWYRKRRTTSVTVDPHHRITAGIRAKPNANCATVHHFHLGKGKIHSFCGEKNISMAIMCHILYYIAAFAARGFHALIYLYYYFCTPISRQNELTLLFIVERLNSKT